MFLVFFIVGLGIGLTVSGVILWTADVESKSVKKLQIKSRE